MPEYPLLFLPQPAEVQPSPRFGRGGAIGKPSATQQRHRLDAKFREIAESFQSIQSTVRGVEPEQVLVLETIGDRVEGLAKAAAQIPGMEWLAEMDRDDLPAQAGFGDEKDPERLLPCRLYAVMTNQQAMNQLLGLWSEWDPEKRAKRNFGPFKGLFTWLHDLRRWSAEDRIRETGLLEYLQERLGEEGAEIRFEVELWCRQNPEARDRSYRELVGLIETGGGQCITQAAIVEINYHGVLVKMPAMAVRKTIQGILSKDYGPLVRCEKVMFFRPAAQSGFVAADLGMRAQDAGDSFADRPFPQGEPIVALFDGLPLEQHSALRDRLLIDDADNHGQSYTPDAQQHGTAMASLVIHGDLNGDGAPLKTPIYVRPILLPRRGFQNLVREEIPDNELFVDLVHRAVRKMLVGAEASAPDVRIVNLSVANSFQPFDRELSPLAKLLDWLSWKHKLLILVSVGNHVDEIKISSAPTQWKNLTSEELRSQVLQSMSDEQATRRPYSPAEAVNVLTVGAIHADESTPVQGDQRVDLLPGARLPSTIGTVAHGFRRAVKPEIFFPGGRQLYSEPIGTSAPSASFSVSESFRPPGQRVAAPADAPLDLARTRHTRGTSNATALATRCAAQIVERLVDLRSEAGGERLDDAELAVLVKCLLVHGASWGAAAQVLEEVFGEAVKKKNDLHQAWRKMLHLKTRFLGYGEVLPERAMFCTDERVTALGWSRIQPNKGHVHSFPLPPALAGLGVKRKLWVTLAWLSPTNPRHRSYRQARLWCNFDKEKLGVAPAEIDSDTARRGTVEHRILEGDGVLAVTEDEVLEVTVSCREDAGGLNNEPVPYALAVTLEVAEPLDVSIYEQVRDAIRPVVLVRPRAS